MFLKCCTLYDSKFEKLSSGQRTGKGQFSFQSQGKAIPKNVQTITHLPSTHTLAKQFSNFYKPGFNIRWTVNFHIFTLDLEKAEEQKIKLPTSSGSLKMQESSRNIYISALLTMPKSLNARITRNCRKFLNKLEYQTTYPSFWEICVQVKKQQLELDMEQQTGSK